MNASGTYRLRSEIDITVEALLPEPAADLVATLRNFSTNPARTLFDLAEAAGVPAVATIRDHLPDYVEDKLEGWINDEIAELELGGYPVTTIAGEVVWLAESALTRFALDSVLAIGTGTATHTLTRLDLLPAGISSSFALGALPGDVVSATPTCSATSSVLAIGDHTYGIAYGQYAWRAADEQILAAYGYDVRGALGAAVDCPALAQRISTKCYWDYCVGHQAELTEICERGLDEVVGLAYDKVAAIRFDALHFISGSATLVDDDSDTTADRLTSGTWNAEIEAGMGLRNVPATFTGTR